MNLIRKYIIKRKKLQYLIRLINRHGYDLLKEIKNKVYSRDFKQEAIDRVLNNDESNI